MAGKQLKLDFGDEFEHNVELLHNQREVPYILTSGLLNPINGRQRHIIRLAYTLWIRLRPDPFGIVLGLVGFLMALTPSLLPRTWLFQGVVCGISAASAYALGVFVHWLWDLWLDDLFTARVNGLRQHIGPGMGRFNSRVSSRSLGLGEFGTSGYGGASGSSGALSNRLRLIIDLVLFITVPIATIIMAFYSVKWQNQLAHSMGTEAYSPAKFLLVLPVGLGLWALLVGVARLIEAVADWLAGHGPSRWGSVTRTIAAWLVLAVVAGIVWDKVVPGTTSSLSDRIFSVRNDQIRADLKQPTVPERSGSPQSGASWDGLGAFGTRFTALGLHKDELSQLTGKPAKEPIRVYAGLKNEPDDQARADLVVRELERTNAKDRQVLFVIPTTGTGWVNPTVAQAIELMFNGDTAIAADQYSYLPSALQFIQNRDEVREAGKVLINTVVDWWNTLPKDHRPRIYVYGESLGTSAGEGAFSGLRDIVNSVDGVLWAGPPNSNQLWSQLVDRRDPGTSEVKPVYSDGFTVRFANGPSDIWSWKESAQAANPSASPLWPGPRALYLQHPSDPVVWWSPNLLFQRPDWLKEPAVGDRSPAMVYRPILTFWQVTLDLPMAANVPNGHGHNYGDQIVDGLAAVAGEGQYSQADMPALKKKLDTAMIGQGPEKEVGVDQSKMGG